MLFSKTIVIFKMSINFTITIIVPIILFQGYNLGLNCSRILNSLNRVTVLRSAKTTTMCSPQVSERCNLPHILQVVRLYNVLNFALLLCLTGVYGPRLRCFDVSQLAMKFERGYDAEAINLLMLSDDYSKVT